jgi:hypothetical protein
MSQPPKPCGHCSNATFHVVPNVRVDISVATTVLGMQARRDLKGVDWIVTIVACTNCGLTQTFTTNAAQLGPHFPGSTTMQGQPR